MYTPAVMEHLSESRDLLIMRFNLEGGNMVPALDAEVTGLDLVCLFLEAALIFPGLGDFEVEVLPTDFPLAGIIFLIQIVY